MPNKEVVISTDWKNKTARETLRTGKRALLK